MRGKGLGCPAGQTWPCDNYCGGRSSNAGKSRNVVAAALTAAGSPVQDFPVRVQARKFVISDASAAAARSAHAASRSASSSGDRNWP